MNKTHCEIAKEKWTLFFFWNRFKKEISFDEVSWKVFLHFKHSIKRRRKYTTKYRKRTHSWTSVYDEETCKKAKLCNAIVQSIQFLKFLRSLDSLWFRIGTIFSQIDSLHCHPRFDLSFTEEWMRKKYTNAVNHSVLCHRLNILYAFA